jgi:hypothetical protein
VAAHRHLCRDAAPVHLKAWLYTIARNRCTSMLRARREALAMDDVHEPSTDGLAVAGEVERREELEELLGDLARLPDDQRAALVLAELGDLSHDEIGTALAVRKDKVKALIFQAREALAGWRQARTADCHEIQEQLATLRGSALRRAPIQRHVALCPVCAAFEQEVARQRTAMALLMPVIPTLALKQTVLSAALSRSGELAGAAGGAGAAGATAAGVTGTAASGLTAKALTVAALAIGTGGAGAIAVREVDPPAPPAKTAAQDRAVSAASPVAGAAAKVSGAAAVAPPRAEHGAATPGRSATAPGRTKAKAHGRPADPHTAGRDRRAHGHGTLKPKHTGPPPHAAKPATPPRSSRAQPQKQTARVIPVAPKLPSVKARKVAPPVVAPPAATLPPTRPVTPPAAALREASPKAHGPNG